MNKFSIFNLIMLFFFLKSKANLVNNYQDQCGHKIQEQKTIKTNGYYYSLKKIKKSEFYDKSIIRKYKEDEYILGISPLVLNPDGTGSISDDFFGVYKLKSCKIKPENTYANATQLLECSLIKDKKLVTYLTYQIEENQIQILYKVPLKINNSITFLMREIKGLVLNDSTIILNRTINKNNETSKINEVYIFRPFDF